MTFEKMVTEGDWDYIEVHFKTSPPVMTNRKGKKIEDSGLVHVVVEGVPHPLRQDPSDRRTVTASYLIDPADITRVTSYKESKLVKA